MSDWRWVSHRAALTAHAEQISEHGGGNGIRDMGLFESAMARPQQLEAYGTPDAATLAAAYAFGLARNHPFVDGNKRTGFVTGVLFLELNGYRFTASEESAAFAVMGLAGGELDEAGYEAFLRENTIRE